MDVHKPKHGETGDAFAAKKKPHNKDSGKCCTCGNQANGNESTSTGARQILIEKLKPAKQVLYY